MGYSYGYSYKTGRYSLLCCDGCGRTKDDGAGPVRKRTCPHKVLGNSHRSPSGHRFSMPYCPPPALCSDCYKKHGGKAIHDVCIEGAAASNAESDAVEAALDAGELLVTAAWGSWADGVPNGKVKVLFTGRAGTNETYVLVDDEAYEPGRKNKLSDYPGAVLVDG